MLLWPVTAVTDGLYSGVVGVGKVGLEWMLAKLDECSGSGVVMPLDQCKADTCPAIPTPTNASSSTTSAFLSHSCLVLREVIGELSTGPGTGGVEEGGEGAAYSAQRRGLDRERERDRLSGLTVASLRLLALVEALDPRSLSLVMTLRERLHWLTSSVMWSMRVVWRSPYLYWHYYWDTKVVENLPPRRHACLLRWVMSDLIS